MALALCYEELLIFHNMSHVLTISLTAELKELVASKVRSGQYGNASEVIREALRNWEAGNENEDSELESLIEQGRATPLVDWSKDLISSRRSSRRKSAKRASVRRRR